MKEAEFAPLLEIVANVPGDLAEIGIAAGTTFAMLYRVAKDLGIRAHGFDSFEGMAAPGPRDGTAYPKGRFAHSKPSVEERWQLDRAHYRLFQGFIPRCFEPVGDDQRYRFVYLDVDHYEPTRIALEWAWGRISSGGLLLLDDWFEGSTELASGAINEWTSPDRELIPLPDAMRIRSRICFRKDGWPNGKAAPC